MQPIQAALSTLPQKSSVDPIPQKWIARIFERLTAQLGSKVSDLYAGVPAEHVQAEWANALSGFHHTEIERGLRACQTRPYAPTLGEFTRLCRPSLDPEFAYIEAQRGLLARDQGGVGEWTHPAVYRAACLMTMEVRAGNYRDVRKRWEVTLYREIDEGWLNDVPPPAIRVTNEVKTRPPTQKEREALAQFAELIRAGFSLQEIRLGMGDAEVHRS